MWMKVYVDADRHLIPWLSSENLPDPGRRRPTKVEELESFIYALIFALQSLETDELCGTSNFEDHLSIPHYVLFGYCMLKLLGFIVVRWVTIQG